MTGIDWVPGGLYVSTFGEGVLYAPLSLTDLAAWRALAAVHAAVSSREVVTLTWPAPPATGVATTFAVASSSDGGSHWHPVAAGVTGTTLRLADLAGGPIYEFAVTAVSPFGESAPVTSLPLTVPRIPLVPLTIAFRARSTALPATAASRVAVFLARLAPGSSLLLVSYGATQTLAVRRLANVVVLVVHRRHLAMTLRTRIAPGAGRVVLLARPAREALASSRAARRSPAAHQR